MASLEDSHQEVCRQRAREVAFGEDSLWILSAEDLLIRTVGCATSWSRRALHRFDSHYLSRGQFERASKTASSTSWIEMAQDLLFARAGELDVDDVRRWLERVIPDPSDHRRASFEDAVRKILGDGSLAEGMRA
jgi:hypothetical protein